MDTNDIWEVDTPKQVYVKVIKMLLHRGWVEQESLDSLVSGYDSEVEIHYIETNGTLPTGGVRITKVKLVIDLSADALDRFKTESFLKLEENCRNIFIFDQRTIGNMKLKFKTYDKPKDVYAHIDIIGLNILSIDHKNHTWAQDHQLVDNRLEIFKAGELWDMRLLMSIYHSDPQARYLGARIGDIIKISTEDQIKFRKVITGYGF